MENEFEGKWGIILGGSSGLGLAAAKKLSSHGMNLIIIHRDRKSSMEEIEKSFIEIRKKVKLDSFNFDALNTIKMKSMIQEIKEITGEKSIHLLLHSIAKGNLKPIVKENKGLLGSDFNLTIQSMGISYYDWVMEALNNDLFSTKARVVAFTSEGSSRVHHNYAAVSAAKASLESISRSLALELAPFSITSNCIMSGTSDTQAFRAIPNHEELKEWSIKRNPYHRLTNPEDVGNALYLLCKKEANWINGTILQVDGGEHLR
jgi:enoyl-[acyl-carrier protein] reductase I